MYEVSVTLFAAGFMAFVLHFSLILWRIRKDYAHIPGPPKCNFLLGHIPSLKAAMEAKDRNLQDLLYNWCETYGMTIKIFIFFQPIVITAHPSGVKETLLGGHPKADIVYNCLYDLYGTRFLGDGLVTATSHSKWRHRRKAMDPAFRRKFLKGLMEHFNSSADTLLTKLEQYLDSEEPFSMAKEFNRVSLDLLGKVAFSLDINSLNDSTSPLPSAVNTVLEGMYRKLFQGDFGYSPFSNPFKERVQKAVRFLRDTGLEMISTRRELILNGGDVPDDILTHAIQISECDPEISVESLLDDFITFFIAGHETTANTLSFMIQEIGRHKEVMARIKEEIRNVVGSSEEITYEHVGRLEYTTMVMKESMRLYPTAPSTFRKLQTQADIGGYTVPKDTVVMVSDYVASRNKEVFDQPLEFRPERFNSKSEEKISIYSFFPFSLGPRSCIGQTFAQIETKLIVAKLLQHYEFELDMSQDFTIEEISTLRPSSGVMCWLRKEADSEDEEVTRKNCSHGNNSGDDDDDDDDVSRDNSTDRASSDYSSRSNFSGINLKTSGNTARSFAKDVASEVGRPFITEPMHRHVAMA